MIAIMDDVTVGSSGNIQLPNNDGTTILLYYFDWDNGTLIGGVNYKEIGNDIVPVNSTGAVYAGPIVVVWDEDGEETIIIEIDHKTDRHRNRFEKY